MSTYETKEIVERVILLGVDVGDDTKESVKELADLVDTAGAVVLDSIIQTRERIHPGTYLGKGKIEEVKERVMELDATGVYVMMSLLQHSLEIWRIFWIPR